MRKSIAFFGAVLLMFCAHMSFAQESIFVPAEMPHESHTADDSQKSALSRWISLDAGLYHVVLRFDARSQQVERAERLFEPAYLSSYEFKMLHPDSENTDPAPGWSQYATLMREPTMCSELNKAVAQYIAQNKAELDSVISKLVAETKDFSEDQKIQMASGVRTAFSAAVPQKDRAYEILYQCLHRQKNEVGVPKSFNFEKTLKDWFIIEARLIDAWMGPVD